MTLFSILAMLALVSGSYCFWLMTIPLSYDLVPVVVGGFILSVLLFFGMLITLLIIRGRRSRQAPALPPV